MNFETLFEQGNDAAHDWLSKVGRADDIPAYVLMRDEEQSDWDISPEKDAILIGTQDMLLPHSPSLGYPAKRLHGPIEA